MRIEKNGQTISSLEDWAKLAGPKSPSQWVEGRSAFELAHAWIGTGPAAMPAVIQDLLDSRPETRGLVVDVAHAEHRIPFDLRQGEPRNADLAFVGRRDSRTVAVTVEAKADEPFGATVSDTMAAALQRWLANERSGGLKRILDLVDSVLPPSDAGSEHASALRYQLLTAVAGTVAYASANKADVGVLIVHEFVTSRTREPLHAKNHEDYRAFMSRLGITDLPNATSLAGPLTVPGGPLFKTPVPLFVGKVTTRVER